MIDAGMTVGGGLVGVEPGTGFQVFPVRRPAGWACRWSGATATRMARAEVFVLIEAPHMGFIDLGWPPVSLRARAVRLRLADVVRQVSGSLVGKAQVPVRLATGYALGSGCRQIDCKNPEPATQVGAVHDRIGFDREIPPTGATAVGLELAHGACLHVVRGAGQTLYAVRPALSHQPAFRRRIVREAVEQFRQEQVGLDIGLPPADARRVTGAYSSPRLGAI